jgi:hypothetical protein
MGRSAKIQRRLGVSSILTWLLVCHSPALSDAFCPCQPGPTRGPRENPCAYDVCQVVSTCCDLSWDVMCAELANSLCGTCSMDCDTDGTPDACEVDADSNGVPDSCEPKLDCNGNGIEDSLDIASQRSLDCGGLIGRPDECEIAANPQLDRNFNGILDSCEQDPCEPHPGPALVRWVGLPNAEQPWEAPYNWLPLQPSPKTRPGWDSVLLDAAVTPKVMDAFLGCDQQVGAMELRQTSAFIALGDSTLEFFDRDPAPGTAGAIRLLENASLHLDPRWPGVGSGNGLLRAGSIESFGAGTGTLLSSSAITRIHVSERIALSGCEILLSGDTATPVFATPVRTVMEARGTLRPAAGVSLDESLDCRIAGTLRSWRAPFDPDGSLVITKEAFDGAAGTVTHLEHASNSENPATLLLLWDWIGVPNSTTPVIDATTAGIGVTIRGAIQVDTTLAAGSAPASQSPSLELIRQPRTTPLGRYSLIAGRPPRGFRFEQREALVTTEADSPEAHALLLSVVAENGTDPAVGNGIGTRLSETEVGKLAIDLNRDGTDEIVIAVRRSNAPGELRVYRSDGSRLVAVPEWTKVLDAGDLNAHDTTLVQPIRPWDGVTGDGQPLDAADFDGDGDLDIAVACEGNAPFRLFVNVGQAGNSGAPGSLPVLADPINASSVDSTQRPTCVAIVPARPGSSLAPTAPGFVGGVATAGDTGLLYRYSVTGFIANRGQGVPVAGVPRSARGGGTVGTQGVGIATGGSTKTKTFNLIEDLNGFVQWAKIDESWDPQIPSASGFSAVGKAVSMKGNAPCDLVVLPFPTDVLNDPICIATANVTDFSGDVTLLRGSGQVSETATGLDAIAPIRSGTSGDGASNITAASLFSKQGAVIPDLLITRRDGKLSAARTDLDPAGSLAVGYVVQIGANSNARSAVGSVQRTADGRTSTAVVSTIGVSGGILPINEILLQPLGPITRADPSSDVDGSGMVDFGDVNLLLLDMGPCTGCSTDLDGNGVVDFGDVTLVLLSFGETS